MKKYFHHSSYWSTQGVLIIFMLAFLCYWPVTWGIFSAKNDNITQFLPVRFHISEALRHGHLPLWTPYIYLGFPMHGDMQGGAWNPVVWLLSRFSRYNLTSLHSEIFLYVFFSGLGMYRLLSALGFARNVCITGAAAYLMCGYITDVGGSNLPFLAAAAYTPFVFAYYYHLLATPRYQYAFKTGIALTLLFVSAYPSFFICTCYVLLAALLSFLARRGATNRKVSVKAILLTQALTGILFIAFSAPAILSYAGILPYYQRGAGVNLEGALQNYFDPSCTISFLFPSVPIKNPASYTTDLISRNSYFNLLLLVFAVCALFIKKTLKDRFILTGVVFFFLFSLGPVVPLRAWCYELLPLMNTFRHPSNARLYVIIGCIVLAIAMYHRCDKGQVKHLHLLGVAVTFALVIIVKSLVALPHLGWASKLSGLHSDSVDTRSALKNFLHTLTYHDHMIANGIVQLVSLLSFFFLIRYQKTKLLPLLIVLNSFVLAQFTIPYTLVTKVSPHTINGVLNAVPAGYPRPDKHISLTENGYVSRSRRSALVMDEFYNKMIAAPDGVVTPTFMEKIRALYADSGAKAAVFSRPYAYLEAPNASFKLDKIWNNGFIFTTVAREDTRLYLQQVYLPGWKGFIDGEAIRIASYHPGFVSVGLPSGKHRVELRYDPAGITAAVLISVLSVLVCALLLYKKSSRDL